ncbi:hypothetical protein DMI62_11385 [Escherichia coli]|nr:hypothetical protein [Escherichia coli]
MNGIGERAGNCSLKKSSWRSKFVRIFSTSTPPSITGRYGAQAS